MATMACAQTYVVMHNFGTTSTDPQAPGGRALFARAAAATCSVQVEPRETRAQLSSDYRRTIQGNACILRERRPNAGRRADSRTGRMVLRKHRFWRSGDLGNVIQDALQRASDPAALLFGREWGEPVGGAYPERGRRFLRRNPRKFHLRTNLQSLPVGSIFGAPFHDPVRGNLSSSSARAGNGFRLLRGRYRLRWDAGSGGTCIESLRPVPSKCFTPSTVPTAVIQPAA